MTANELAKLISGKTLGANGDNIISCGMVCDLLSHAMAHGKPGCAWICVQTHITTVAVALLCGAACIIWPDNIEPDAASIKKADEEGIAIIASPLPAYSIAGILCAAGIPAA